MGKITFAKLKRKGFAMYQSKYASDDLKKSLENWARELCNGVDEKTGSPCKNRSIDIKTDKEIMEKAYRYFGVNMWKSFLCDSHIKFIEKSVKKADKIKEDYDNTRNGQPEKGRDKSGDK